MSTPYQNGVLYTILIIGTGMKTYCYRYFTNIDTFKAGSAKRSEKIPASKGSAKTDLVKTAISETEKETLSKQTNFPTSKHIFTIMGKIQIDSKINPAGCITPRQELFKQIPLVIYTTQIAPIKTR